MAKYETNDQVWDAIKDEFVSRGRTGPMARTVDENGVLVCLYKLDKDPNGIGCAIGCLIPPDLYDAEYDSGNPSLRTEQVLDDLYNGDLFGPGVSQQMLIDLQDLHDNSLDPHAFVNLLYFYRRLNRELFD